MPQITTVNIKDKPIIEEIVKGNFLIVENENGTNIIDFDNFVAGPKNVSFYTQFQTVSTNVFVLSGEVTTKTSGISAQANTLITQKFDSLSATVDARYGRLFYAAGQLTIDTNNTISNSVAVIVPAGVTLQLQDINLTFNTTATPAVSGTLIILYPTLNGTTPNYSLQVNVANPCNAPIIVSYNILKPY